MHNHAYRPAHPVSHTGTAGPGADRAASAKRYRYPAGTQLFAQGAPCQGFPLVLAGEVQVACHAEDGRSLELYRVRPGGLCLVSSASLFRGLPLGAQGVSADLHALNDSARAI